MRNRSAQFRKFPTSKKKIKVDFEKRIFNLEIHLLRKKKYLQKRNFHFDKKEFKVDFKKRIF